MAATLLPEQKLQLAAFNQQLMDSFEPTNPNNKLFFDKFREASEAVMRDDFAGLANAYRWVQNASAENASQWGQKGDDRMARVFTLVGEAAGKMLALCDNTHPPTGNTAPTTAPTSPQNGPPVRLRFKGERFLEAAELPQASGPAVTVNGADVKVTAPPCLVYAVPAHLQADPEKVAVFNQMVAEVQADRDEQWRSVVNQAMQAADQAGAKDVLNYVGPALTENAQEAVTARDKEWAEYAQRILNEHHKQWALY